MAIKLIFDIIITGHHAEYIGHLVEYLIKVPDNHRYVIVTHPDFPERFPDIANRARGVDNIQISEITDKELEESESGGLLKRSFSWYKIANRYASKHKADHVILMYFNLFQLPLILFRPKYRISGILFLQFYRMEKNSRREKLKYFRKYYITKLFSRNPKIDKVFVLNDRKTATYLNHEFRTKIFDVLHDPIPRLAPAQGFDIYAHYNIERQRKIFLHLGALSDRKGTLEFIQSALFLKNELQSHVTFLITGSPGGQKMSEKIEKQINRINSATNVTAVYEPGFLANEKMKSVLDHCFAVVIPYKNPEASSGILGHAAAANKPIVTTGKGLLKELIEENNLGLLVDEVKPEHIAKKIEVLLSLDEWKTEAIKFVSERTPISFASKILEQQEAF